MTVLTFPTNPTLGQQYAAPNGIQYVFDGVKWIVETVASTSAAVTNSVQDRVAPMFVDGTHDGITFSYNAATNVMSAEVTAVNGDSLVNGVHELTLENNGTVTLDGDPFTSFSGDYDDLSNKPTIPAAQIQSDWTQSSNVALDFIKNKPTIPPAYTLPTATTSVLGGVKVDGTTVTITDGVISSVGGGGGDANIWVQTFETATPATDVPQVATSVEYDSDGNIIALFSHINPVDDSTYYSVGKYTTTGTRIWTARFADGFNTDGWGLAVDNTGGFVYIAGRTSADGGQDNATLTKISGTTGLVEWSKVYDFGYNSSSPVVDVNANGDPVMVGFAENGDDRYVTTTKIDAELGTVIWSRALDGQNDEEAFGMAVGPSGEVVAVGYMATFGVQNAAATLYTVPASNPNWTTGVSGPVGGVNFSSVTFTDGVPTFTNVSDTLGNRSVDDVLGVIGGNAFGGTSPADDMTVKVATLAANDTDDRMLVVKYAANGTIAWQKAIQFDAGFDCSGADADIDSEGNIYVCGQYGANIPGPISQLMSIVKFNSSGVKQWSRRVVGNCGQWSSSIVVGADDHLYLSATTFAGTENTVEDIHLVLAKYSFDGLVAWQRLLDYTAGYSFGTNFFGSDIGGSNLAVKQDYVAVGLGFGGEDLFGGPGSVNAAVAQISATGDIFTVGNWDFKSASFSGVVNSSASDITVVNAGKTDIDNVSNINVSTVTLQFDSSAFLIGTLYSAGDSSDRLVNGAYEVVLGASGTVTLPAGGTITEGYVTSNPTIQLTPASPDVASQKLVIKGGGSYDYTDNGININYYTNTAIVGDTLTFYVNSSTYAGQTLYWWIYPEGAGISDPGSGTVVLDGNSGTISFVLDSDDNEFTLRVSPEANNYDPSSLGVESGLINPDAPTFDFEHHLHLTTGNLAETSIFLGTDDHNVRTTVNGGIEITTPNTTDNVWRFGTDGTTTFPTLTVERGDDPSNTITGQTLLFGDSTQEAIISTPNGTVANNSSQRLVINPGEGHNGGEGGDIYLWAGRGGDASGTGGDIKIRGGQGGANTDGGAGGDGGYIRIEAGDAASTGGDAGYVDIHGGLSTTSGGTVNIRTATTNTFNHAWQFGNNGTLTLPKASKVSEVTPATGPAPSIYPTPSISSIPNEDFVTTPPPAVNNYTIPGTDIVINMTFGANGPNYYGPTATIVNGGSGHTSDESLSIPYADMGIDLSGNWPWFVNTIASNLVLEAGTKDWTFGADGNLTLPNNAVIRTDGGNVEVGGMTNFNVEAAGVVNIYTDDGAHQWQFGDDGTLTLPGALVKSTVAKTGVILPTTTGIPSALSGTMVGLGIADGTYGPFTKGGVTFSVTVAGGGISGFINISSTSSYAVNATIGQLTSEDLGDPPGQTTNIGVDSVVQATPTALDLTKSVNKLTTGYYTLADGVEGQVMHLVRQTSTNNATVIVANARVAGDQYTALEHYPFTAGDIGMLIFTDGAWQQQGGSWD